MKVSTLRLSRLGLTAILLCVPMTAAFAQVGSTPVDTDTATPTPPTLSTPAAVNDAGTQPSKSAMLAALQTDLAVSIGKVELQASDISDSFQQETDINRPPGVPSPDPSVSTDPNVSQYMALTKAAGTELTTQQFEAAAKAFQQAAALYPGRTAAQYRAAIALALAGDEDDATLLASKLEVIGDPPMAQAAGDLVNAIANAKDASMEPQPQVSTPAPELVPAPELTAPIPPTVEPAPAPDESSPSTIDTLTWIVDKLSTQSNHYASLDPGLMGPAHVDDFNYGFVQNTLVVTHKQIWRLADTTPVITTDTINLDADTISSVSVTPIQYGNMAGASAITIGTSGEGISLHKTVRDVEDPWNPRTNVDTTRDVSYYDVFVVSDNDVAQRIGHALQHIADINAAAPKRDLF